MTKNTGTFKEAFCTVFKCRPEDYTRKMLCRSFSQHAAWIARILLALDTPSIQLAVETIELLGQAKEARDVNMILNDYRYRLRKPSISSFVQTFKIRLSGSRIMDLFAQVSQKAAHSSSPSEITVPSPGLSEPLKVE